MQFDFESSQAVILDVRVPCTPVARLSDHRPCVDGVTWAPHSSCHICTAGVQLVSELSLKDVTVSENMQ